jgi:putative DNA primase/helicase
MPMYQPVTPVYNILDDDSPLTAARAFVRSIGCEHTKLFNHHNGEFYLYELLGGVHRRCVKEVLRADLWRWAELQQVPKGGEAVPYKPTTRKVNEILDALAALVQVSIEQMPAWLGLSVAEVQDVIAFPNAMLDMGPCLLGDDPSILDTTPNWFSENVLPFNYDPQAICPEWLAFLADVLSDEELIALVQEFFGLALTGDTSMQKALLLIGPPRSGKGTTLRQLVRIVGDANCASLRLTALGETFGLQALASKTLAVCPDAHLGRSADTVAVLERLKSIIGEDPQCIDRKFREPLANVRMRTRFVLAVNNFPDLPDSSVAMRSRLLLVPFGNSYEGVEDRTLEARLADEAPGTVNWAIEGLKRLRRNGRFTEPAVSRDLMRDFCRLSSPVLAFVEDCCETGNDSEGKPLWVECDAAWLHWKRYCDRTGTAAGNKQAFGLNLKSAVPSIRRTRPYRDDGSRFWSYTGIGLSVIPQGVENE